MCEARAYDEVTQYRLRRLRKYVEIVSDRVSTPFITEMEYIELQARVMPEIKSQKGRVDFIVNIAEASRNSIVKMLEKHGHHDAANIAREVKVTPWL